MKSVASSQHSDVEAVAAAGDSHAAAAERPAVARMVEDIVGCKWSLAVLGAVRRGIHRNMHDGLQLEADLFGAISSTAEMKEGMAAFLEKRKASWVRG